MRKIIQIASAGVAENETTQCEMFIHALCDDGTVWQLDNRRDGWRELIAIPQDNK